MHAQQIAPTWRESRRLIRSKIRLPYARLTDDAIRFVIAIAKNTMCGMGGLASIAQSLPLTMQKTFNLANMNLNI